MIMDLSVSEMQFFLSDYFLLKDATTEEEILCERAFLLKRLGNPYAVSVLADLIDRDDTRYVLEGKYDFTVKDFYDLSGQ